MHACLLHCTLHCFIACLIGQCGLLQKLQCILRQPLVTRKLLSIQNGIISPSQLQISSQVLVLVGMCIVHSGVSLQVLPVDGGAAAQEVSEERGREGAGVVSTGIPRNIITDREGGREGRTCTCACCPAARPAPADYSRTDRWYPLQCPPLEHPPSPTGSLSWPPREPSPQPPVEGP
jgi:hypothetical protein